MAGTASTASAAAQHAVDSARAHLGAVDPTSEVIAGMKDHPAAKQLIAAAQAQGAAIVDATDSLNKAIDFDKVAATAEASAAKAALPGHVHTDIAKLRDATDQLKQACDLTTVVAAVQTLANDDALMNEMREGFKAKGLTGGTDEVRGALKSVDVDHTGIIQHLNAVIAHAGDHADEDKEAITHLQAELHNANDKLKQGIGDLVKALDGLVAKLAV